MATKKDAPGMYGLRSRNDDGLLRQKRSDTLIRTIEKNYRIELGVRGDMELGTYLQKNNVKSLNDIINGK